MRGLVDIIVFFLAVATLIGWSYFAFLFIDVLGRFLQPVFGEASAVVASALLILAIGLAFGLGAKFASKTGLNALLLVGALAMAGIGIYSLKKGKW